VCPKLQFLLKVLRLLLFALRNLQLFMLELHEVMLMVSMRLELALVVLYSLVLASAEPVADPFPAADPQTFSNYAPFSGAIYIVNGGQGGTQFSSASPAQCPANAPQGCGNINVWNWCCPSSNTCQNLSNGIVGCCPSGATCSGSVNANQITTVTVTTTVAMAATINTFVQVPGSATTVGGGVGGVLVNGPATGTTRLVPAGPFCTTLYMNGYPIPTAVRAGCGTMLIMSPPASNAGHMTVNSSESLMWTFIVAHSILGLCGGIWGVGRFMR